MHEGSAKDVSFFIVIRSLDPAQGGLKAVVRRAGCVGLGLHMKQQHVNSKSPWGVEASVPDKAHGQRLWESISLRGGASTAPCATTASECLIWSRPQRPSVCCLTLSHFRRPAARPGRGPTFTAGRGTGRATASSSAGAQRVIAAGLPWQPESKVASLLQVKGPG